MDVSELAREATAEYVMTYTDHFGAHAVKCFKENVESLVEILSCGHAPSELAIDIFGP
jgi:hypothetical protein